jgi:hypothetical protein
VDSSTSLHGFADIVAYSHLSPYQQAECQERLLAIIDASLRDAGVRPDCMSVQHQGDACMLTFPNDNLDVSRVLAVMPRHFHDELSAYNRDRSARARLRVRLAFAMGPTAPGVIGRTGSTPITVVRLNNASALRAAMTAQPEAQLGLIVEDDLYRKHVAQEFRPDLAADDYVEVRVSDPVKEFDQHAWIRLVGYPASAIDDGGQGVGVPGPPPQAIRPPRPASRPAGDAPTAREGAASATSGVEAGRRRRRFPLSPAWATIIAAVITAGVTVGIWLSSGTGSTGTVPPKTSSTTTGQGTASASAGSSASVGPTSSGPAPSGKTITEYANWYLGVNIYTNNQAATSNAPLIPFKHAVQVSCYASNDSGIESINAFYLIASGPWKGTYASANEFSNGGSVGSSNVPAIDARVPACPTS